jgi:ABC transporter
MLTLIDRLQFH